MNRYLLVFAAFILGCGLEVVGFLAGWPWVDVLGSLAQGAAFGVAIGAPSGTWIRPDNGKPDLSSPVPCRCGHDLIYHTTIGCYEDRCRCQASRHDVLKMAPVQDVLHPINPRGRA